ncbi:MAG: hypothetical protein BGO05_21890 [Rhizobiales bacterium 63-7]|nr:hypothetical protein [Hyphomicrobiales bacterium]OJU69883.1 MAG: hypothetical protein BGO05_21890 [Rhizobiales bacterium 63-7]
MSIFSAVLDRRYRSLDQLDKALANCKTLADLRRLYHATMPGKESGYNTAHDMDYCSGAAYMVVQYLIRKDPGYLPYQEQKELSPDTSETILKVLLKAKGPYYGYLCARSGSAHECVFAKTGMRWGFYQANNTGEGHRENFSLAQHLNAGKGLFPPSWNRTDMDEATFVEFFRGLTQRNARWLFVYNRDITSWALTLRSFDGRSLLDKSFKASAPPSAGS